MARRWWKTLVIIAVVSPLLMWGFDRILMTYWVGSTNLSVEFVVYDGANGDPVPNACVEVQSEGGFYADDFKQEFTLPADARGTARKECLHSMSFGTRSGLGFTDTFVVHLPWWRFRVVAEGYGVEEWKDLDVHEYIRQTHRDGPGRAKLVVPVELQRKAGPGPAEVRAPCSWPTCEGRA